jgi:signal transduction histidine kinase
VEGVTRDEEDRGGDISETSPARVYQMDASLPPLAGETVKEDLALQRRPVFTIRAQLVVSFTLVFALCAAVTIWSIYTLSRLQQKLHFLQVTDSYMTEIQQARRFEKNYLLYGTNLEDALEHLKRAEDILGGNREMMERVLGARNARIMSSHFQQYRNLLGSLDELPAHGKSAGIETELRRHGSKMISFAMELAQRERDSVDRTFVLSRRMPFVFLAMVLVLMLAIATFLSHQLLGTLSRFMEYTERIGRGDFSPITPARPYRDEFSRLAVAFNQMTHELERRHRILVESHKMRAVGNLVAGVAHELNNPLNNIFLTASALQEDADDLSGEERAEMVDDLMKEAERSQKIVRNLLDFARENEMRIEPLDLEDILRGSIRLVSNQVRISKVALDVRIPPDLPPVHGDGQMLSQVFVNLILNAVDVLPEGGRIWIEVHPNPGMESIAVDIRDDGPGIPDRVLDRIFDPFFTTKARGTGLGLSVSQGIAKKLGGYIEVRSRSGEGTTFTVFLPKTDVPFGNRS